MPERMADRHPIITDTLAVLEREVGPARTLAILADCAIRQAAETVPQLLAFSRRGAVTDGQAIEQETAYGLWAALWDTFAEERPQAFAVQPSSLTGRPSPTSLAYLYALKRDQLKAYAPKSAEKNLLVPARAALADWTGLASFGRLQIHSFANRCRALRALETVDGWVGMSLADQQQLADRIVVDARYINRQRQKPGGSFEISSLIVHEEIHGAFAAERALRPPLYAQKLAGAVNEAATSFLEIAATAYAEEGTVSLAAVRRKAAKHGYRRQIVALSRLLPQRAPVDDCARLLTEMIETTLLGGTDFAAAHALNRLSGCCRPVAAYATLFGEV